MNANPIGEPEARALADAVNQVSTRQHWANRRNPITGLSLRMRQRLQDARAARVRQRPT